MSLSPSLRRLAFALLSTCTVSTAFVAAPVLLGTTTVAQAQVPAEFQSALAPYGEWVRHPRWGMVWIPDDRPRGWRPYTEGHWVYTDEWGWYWISDDEEADWGWVAYHYGRWVLDRRMGWVWVPGDEWAPAWVDWRRGGDYVGWAPAPPDDVIYEYDDTPTWWIFVAPRYMTAPRLRTYIVPPRRTTVIIRQTVIVNRTVVVEQPGQQRKRFAVNPGIAPSVVGAIAHQPVRTFRVAPRVLPVTQGVQGAVTVQPQALKPGGRNVPGARRPPSNPQLRVSVQPTNQTVAPATSVAKPQALPKNERGRLGDQPPRAAQGAQPAPPPAPGAAPTVAPQQQQPLRPAPNGRPTPPPSAPAVKPATPPPTQPAPQVQPLRPAQPQTPPPPPSTTRPPAPPATHAPTAPPPPPPSATKPPTPPAARPAAPPPPAVTRPAPPPPPAIQHAPPPAARPAPPPPQAHPAPPPAARPAPPPPQAHPAPPPAARPAPPPPRPGAPPPKPGEKKPPPKPGEKPAEQPN